MNKLVIASLMALALTTGFTCSKNAPEATAPAADQAGMAAPAEGAAPTEGAAAPAEGTTAPAEGAAPAPTENK